MIANMSVLPFGQLYSTKTYSYFQIRCIFQKRICRILRNRILVYLRLNTPTKTYFPFILLLTNANLCIFLKYFGKLNSYFSIILLLTFVYYCIITNTKQYLCINISLNRKKIPFGTAQL